MMDPEVPGLDPATVNTMDKMRVRGQQETKALKSNCHPLSCH